jgi:two-component system, NtrC family, response regulator AtoC
MVSPAISKIRSKFSDGELPPASIIFGSSAAMQAVRQKVEKVAASGVPILIQGDSGTGKGLLARFIHNLQSVPDTTFVKVNCAAIPGSLLESELFGYEKGAFTGAYAAKPGRVELAHGGTLFLDGIDDIDLSLQAKLLQLLQDGQFSRIGGQEDKRVNVRVICATNRQLEHEVAQGRFRQDLFYRINVLSIQLPPLRARAEDISGLVSYFLDLHRLRHNLPAKPLSPAAMRLLEKHPWPGNIRELENLVKRYVIVGNEAQIIRELSTHKPIMSSLSVAAGQGNGRAAESTAPAKASLYPTPQNIDEMPSLLEIGRRAAMAAEREAIERVLTQTRWNRRQAAKILKISYKALLNKLKVIEEQNQAQAKQRPA